MQKLAGLITESEYNQAINESALKNKIKELVHSSLGEAKKKKKNVAPQDDSVELDMGPDAEEPTMDAGTEMPTDTMSPEVSNEIDIDPKVKAIQDSLSKALANAKALGDEKLVNQIGNTITMLVRTQVVGQQSVAESLEESILKIYHYDPSSHKLMDVDAQSYSSEEEAKIAALAHNWQIAYDNGDTDLSKEEYIQKHSWEDLDNISYENYGYEII